MFIMVPKLIWLWWEQGWSKAPYICSYTVESFTKMNPDYKIHLLDRDNINNFIDTEYNWLFNCQGAAFRADIIRLLLLQKYGGVYADAATFCCTNISSFIDEIEFNQFWGFDIKSFNKKEDKRSLASWFYISIPNTYIINKFTDTFLENAKKNPINHEYYLHHYTLTDLINNDVEFKSWYHKLIKISAFQNRIHATFLSSPCTTVIKMEEWFHPIEIKSLIKCNAFKILKLTHKNIGNKTELLTNGSYFSLLIHSYLQ